MARVSLLGTALCSVCVCGGWGGVGRDFSELPGIESETQRAGLGKKR